MRKHFFLCKVSNMNEKHELILGCMRWAEALAVKERKRSRLPLKDLRGAAYEGLCRAAEDYDPGKGAFTTWSKVHIRERFTTLRRSLRMATGFRQWYEVGEEEISDEDRPLVAALHEGLTLEKAAERVGLSKSAANWRVSKILWGVGFGRVSLDPWLDHEGHPIQASPWEEEDRQAHRQQVAIMLRELRGMSQEHRDVIAGVIYGEQKFRDVGPAMGVTKQRAHQRYRDAIKELQKRCKKYC